MDGYPLLKRYTAVAGLCTIGVLASPGTGAAQSPQAGLDALAQWTVLDVATGYETRSAEALARALGPGWSADAWGNVVLRTGSGTPRRVVACALDRPALAVSEIRADGYLRVHRIGRGSRHPLWDQAHEAQQVRILTAAGPVAGVVASPNGHFAQQHAADSAVVSADQLWVDVGARDASEVRALGIELLDPVTRHWPAWSYAGGVAAPDAGRRVGCAAVATVGERARAGGAPAGESWFVLSAQEVFGWVGLSALLARSAPVADVILVGPGEAAFTRGTRSAERMGNLGGVLGALGLSQVTWIAPRVEAPGALSERVQAEDAAALRTAVADAAGVSLSANAPWLAPPARAALHVPPTPARLVPAADLLRTLVELHAVPGHEWAVRRAVLEAMPPWARERALVDDVGNVIVEAGPDRDTTVFMAHMDEVGYEIESIAPNGVVTLGTRGGAVSSAWEGQTALVHIDPPGMPSVASGEGGPPTRERALAALQTEAAPPLRGVFLTRDVATRKRPSEMQAWFGLDAEGLATRGVRVGAGVTSHKEGLRLGPTRFTARALDDRAGSTALLLALRSIDPERLTHKVLFTWSVAEEGGLRGAGVMARRYGASARRIFSIDTFVSSDTPLESSHFAYAPLGAGPVLRSIENSSVSPPAERARVLRIAEAAGLPVQVGLTQGGTDGTTFTFWGAPNAGLSWPGRYSHAPGEVLDLVDLGRLAELIAAVALAPEA